MTAEFDDGFEEIDADALNQQYVRLRKCVEIADLLESAFGKNKLNGEPYLSDPDNESSDLLFDCDFGGDKQTQVSISLNGRVRVYNQIVLLQLIGDRRLNLQDLLMGSGDAANDVVRGDC